MIIIIITDFIICCLSKISSCYEVIIILISNSWASKKGHEAKVITEILQKRRYGTKKEYKN